MADGTLEVTGIITKQRLRIKIVNATSPEIVKPFFYNSSKLEARVEKAGCALQVPLSLLVFCFDLTFESSFSCLLQDFSRDA